MMAKDGEKIALFESLSADGASSKPHSFKVTVKDADFQLPYAC
jgi:hypothetical protein